MGTPAKKLFVIDSSRKKDNQVTPPPQWSDTGYTNYTPGRSQYLGVVGQHKWYSMIFFSFVKEKDLEVV